MAGPSTSGRLRGGGLAHSGGSIAWVFSTTLLQKYTDDKFRGRVFSAEFAFMMADACRGHVHWRNAGGCRLARACPCFRGRVPHVHSRLVVDSGAAILALVARSGSLSHMASTATHDDANLILRLYELRRESKLREAREWFGANFKGVKTMEDVTRLGPPGSKGMRTFGWSPATGIWWLHLLPRAY